MSSSAWFGIYKVKSIALIKFNMLHADAFTTPSLTQAAAYQSGLEVFTNNCMIFCLNLVSVHELCTPSYEAPDDI